MSADDLFTELAAAVEAAPPLRAIELIGFSDEVAALLAHTAQRFAACQLRFHPLMSFDKLDRLVIGTDYPQALQRYEADGIAFSASYAELAETSLAIVLPTLRGLILIVHPQVMFQLLSPNHDELVKGVRVFMHELCHVHDLGLRGEWQMHRAQHRDAASDLYWLCSSMWAEYFANRYSYFDGADVNDDWRRLDLLLEHLPRLAPLLATQRLASAFGYALGTLAAMGESLACVQPDLADKLASRGLRPAWVQADIATRRLGDTGECWQHKDGLQRLATAARLLEQACASICQSSPSVACPAA